MTRSGALTAAAAVATAAIAVLSWRVAALPVGSQTGGAAWQAAYWIALGVLILSWLLLGRLVLGGRVATAALRKYVLAGAAPSGDRPARSTPRCATCGRPGRCSARSPWRRCGWLPGVARRWPVSRLRSAPSSFSRRWSSRGTSRLAARTRRARRRRTHPAGDARGRAGCPHHAGRAVRAGVPERLGDHPHRDHRRVAAHPARARTSAGAGGRAVHEQPDLVAAVAARDARIMAVRYQPW